MDQFDVKVRDEAKEMMRKLRKSISPLAAVLLVADYHHPELESAISKLHIKDVERIDARFNLVFQLIQNQKNKFYRPKDDTFSTIKNRYDDTYCDFKEVMKILGRSRNTLESLINKGEINPVPHKPGKKRSFIRAEIIKYVQGIR